MRLRTNIFLYVSLAILLPIGLLVWALIAYSEARYQEDVDQSLATAINTYVAAMDNRLRYEREVIDGIAAAPAMQNLLPALENITQGEPPARLEFRREKLNLFLENLQKSVPGLGVIRVLDVEGNTLVKVFQGTSSLALVESINGIRYVEEELQAPDFLQRLRNLPPGELNFALTPEPLWGLPDDHPPTLLSSILPLSRKDTVIGYLVVSTFGEYLDQALELAQRPHEGELLIAELNPDMPGRDGLILYSDITQARFSEPVNEQRLQWLENGALWRALQVSPFGGLNSRDGRYRYQYLEYYPYPNRLVSWGVIIRVDTGVIAGPFASLRRGIVFFALLALSIGLLLSNLGARLVARPVTQLADNLKAYADRGERRTMAKVATDEIQQLCGSFHYMAEKLEQAREARRQAEQLAFRKAKMASIGEMAAGIGHEINNPLNNIMNLAKLIERGLPESDRHAHEDIQALQLEVRRARDIVRGVMNFARQVPPEHERFQVGPWLEELVALCEDEAAEHDVWLSLKEPPDCKLEADRVQLRQVMVNLINNAIHASPAGETVNVAARCNDRFLTLTVEDRGTGIDPELIDRIYDPFFTTKPTGKGTGLGLSICLGIIQYHGGLMSIDNNPDGRGSTATVTIPLTKSKPTSAGLLEKPQDV